MDKGFGLLPLLKHSRVLNVHVTWLNLLCEGREYTLYEDLIALALRTLHEYGTLRLVQVMLSS